jgi:SM-20-related protein
MPEAEPPVELDPQLDRALIRDAFTRVGRVHIPGIFTGVCAARLYRCLAEETPWQLHVNDGQKHFDAADLQLQLIPSADRALLLDTVYRNATNRFQCIYNSFPVYDAYHQGRQLDLYVMQVYRFLNSKPFLEFAREITGLRTIALADAQATLFRPGHFLTQHDDTDAGKRRVAAYVLSFTKNWKADWGGVLQFIDRDGHVAEGYTPGFNALNLFKVPQAHCVSFVAPFAAAGRYSISGWLREA